MTQTPNNILRKLQIKGWQKYPIEVKTWIMMANFFFAVVPALLFVIRNVFIEDETLMERANIKNTGFWVILIIFSIGFFQSLFQLMFYQRFMALRLVKTFFFGQCVGLIVLLLAANKNFIQMLRFVVKKKENDSEMQKFFKKIGAFCFLLLVVYIVFFAYRFSSFSEI